VKPFLISPLSAIQNHAVNQGTGDVQWVLDNYNLNDIRSVASQASTALVFVSTDSGEGYITVDGNLNPNSWLIRTLTNPEP